MNKKVLILSVVGVFTSLVLVHGATISSPTMRVGAKGKDVVLLQDFLINKGYLVIPQGVSKGTFGTLTREAVKKFQKDNNIEQTGNFGVKTKSAYLSMTGSISSGALPEASKQNPVSKNSEPSCVTFADGNTSCQSDEEASCKAKGGFYNECGSLCDSSKEGVICPAVCVKTCTMSRKNTTPELPSASTSTAVTASDQNNQVSDTKPISDYTPTLISTDRIKMCDDRPEGGSCKYLSEQGVTNGTCIAVKESLVCQ